MASPRSSTTSTPTRAEALAAEIGGTAVDSNREVAEGSDLVILAHKPAVTEEAAEQVGDAAKAIASIVGTVPTTRLEAAYPGVPVYRFIPNIPVEVGRGVLCYAPGALAADGPEDDVLKLFGRAGDGGAAARGPDRSRDGDHELRAGLRGAGGRRHGGRGRAARHRRARPPRAW